MVQGSNQCRRRMNGRRFSTRTLDAITTTITGTAIHLVQEDRQINVEDPSRRNLFSFFPQLFWIRTAESRWEEPTIAQRSHGNCPLAGDESAYSSGTLTNITSY